MITKERLNELYREELQKAISLGIPIPVAHMPKEIVTMKATSKFGDCYWEYGPRKTKVNIRIRVSEYHLANGEDAVRQTIAHEICHAAPGRGHDETWRKWANMFNTKYGYHISRTGTHNAGYTLERPGPVRGHKVVCTKCGFVYTRTRHSNLTLHPEQYSCGQCKGELVLEY